MKKANVMLEDLQINQEKSTCEACWRRAMLDLKSGEWRKFWAPSLKIRIPDVESPSVSIWAFDVCCT